MLQDIFVKVWKRTGQYDTGKGRLFTWLLNITRNTGRDYLHPQHHDYELPFLLFCFTETVPCFLKNVRIFLINLEYVVGRCNTSKPSHYFFIYPPL
ncbi:sigma factor [Runella sp.]|uniref:sigma factor n=1 Tax=Runella sp. TaxID=1960881 RepID=UPI003D0D77A0